MTFRTVEVLRLRGSSLAWDEVPPLGEARYRFPSVGVVGGRLYAAGGRGEDGGALDTAEYFDEGAQSWRGHGSRLFCPRAGQSTSFLDLDWCNELELPGGEDDHDGDIDGLDGEGGGKGRLVFSSSGIIQDGTGKNLKNRG